MSDLATPVHLERLLAHRDWIRAVARSMALDAATADDLEQETWLEALRAPPRNDRNLRGWLGTVLRNRARKRGRSGVRRSHHETAAALSLADETAPATAEVVADADAHRRVVEAVLALDEPYRTTLLLRFYEGLPPREIADRMGVPGETVRTRVRRAVERLRESLGGSDPSGLHLWMGAIAPLLGAASPSNSAAGLAAKGALAMSMKKTLAAATLAGLLIGGVGALVVAVWNVDDVPVANPVVPIETAEAEPTAPLPVERVRVTSPPRVVVTPTPDPAPSPAPEPEPEAAAPAPPPPAVATIEMPVAASLLPMPAADEPLPKNATKADKRRAKIRRRYEGKRGGYAFYDLTHWVDVAKLEDSRWSRVKLLNPSRARGVQLRAKWQNEASAASGMTIDIFCQKFDYYKQSGSTRTPYSVPFEMLGESVRTDDLEGLLHGFSEDWKLRSKDVSKNLGKKFGKSRHKVPDAEVAVVATDATTGQRERREWYGWSDGKETATYIIEIRYGAATVGKEGLLAKGVDFVRNLIPIKDKRPKDDE